MEERFENYNRGKKQIVLNWTGLEGRILTKWAERRGKSGLNP